MNDIERLAASVQMLVNGWHERIEYKVRVGDVVEARAKSVRHSALLVQLHEAAQHTGGGGTNGGAATNKPGSRPPGNPAPLHLIDTITEEARSYYHNLCSTVNGHMSEHVRKRSITQTLHDLVQIAMAAHGYANEVREVAWVAGVWVRKSRVLLGYDKPHVLLRDMVCGTCGGALVVASDASTDVRCIGTNDAPSCGQVYPRWQWLDLLGEAGA